MGIRNKPLPEITELPQEATKTKTKTRIVLTVLAALTTAAGVIFYYGKGLEAGLAEEA